MRAVGTMRGSTTVGLAAVTDDLRLLTVHAHPDDEASKGAATVAKYVAEGVQATLVCCTGGEAGEVLNPALDRPEVHANLAEVRQCLPGRTSRRHTGTGFGLCNARRFVEAHEGTLRIDSKENQGTTVTIVLPIA